MMDKMVLLLQQYLTIVINKIVTYKALVVDEMTVYRPFLCDGD